MHALEKEMATHSGILAWRIPGTEEPGGLLSVGSHKVRHDRSDLAAAAATLPYISRYRRSLTLGLCSCQTFDACGFPVFTCQYVLGA